MLLSVYHLFFYRGQTISSFDIASKTSTINMWVTVFCSSFLKVELKRSNYEIKLLVK